MSNDNEQWDMSGINWGMLSILITAVLFWTSVWYNGFFLSLMWLIIISAISILYLRLTGRI